MKLIIASRTTEPMGLASALVLSVLNLLDLFSPESEIYQELQSIGNEIVWSQDDVWRQKGQPHLIQAEIEVVRYFRSKGQIPSVDGPCKVTPKLAARYFALWLLIHPLTCKAPDCQIAEFRNRFWPTLQEFDGDLIGLDSVQVDMGNQQVFEILLQWL